MVEDFGGLLTDEVVSASVMYYGNFYKCENTEGSPAAGTE